MTIQLQTKRIKTIFFLKKYIAKDLETEETIEQNKN